MLHCILMVDCLAILTVYTPPYGRVFKFYVNFLGEIVLIVRFYWFCGQSRLCYIGGTCLTRGRICEKYFEANKNLGVFYSKRKQIK